MRANAVRLARCCAQVIDLISLKPFDMETISKSVRKTRHAIIVEECMKTGGIGASLSAIINETLFDELDHQARLPGPRPSLPSLPPEAGRGPALHVLPSPTRRSFTSWATVRARAAS
jgi:pyruvate/2-oxoglutarate/acetoin dehydrogenase E1 component